MATDGNGMASCWLAFSTPTGQRSCQFYRVERTLVPVKLHCGELMRRAASLISGCSALLLSAEAAPYAQRRAAVAVRFIFLLAPISLPLAHHPLRY